MTPELCPKCGKSRIQESRHPCRCDDVVLATSHKGINGRFVVKCAIGIALLITLLAICLFFLVVRLRVAHGLPGLHH